MKNVSFSFDRVPWVAVSHASVDLDWSRFLGKTHLKEGATARVFLGFPIEIYKALWLNPDKNQPGFHGSCGSCHLILTFDGSA